MEQNDKRKTLRTNWIVLILFVLICGSILLYTMKENWLEYSLLAMIVLFNVALMFYTGWRANKPEKCYDSEKESIKLFSNNVIIRKIKELGTKFGISPAAFDFFTNAIVITIGTVVVMMSIIFLLGGIVTAIRKDIESILLFYLFLIWFTPVWTLARKKLHVMLGWIWLIRIILSILGNWVFFNFLSVP